MRGLTRLQRRVTKIVLAATAPHDFALAGGAALIVSRLSPRPTDDIDAFSATVTDVQLAGDQVVAALETEGFTVERDRWGLHFVRLIATSGSTRRRRHLKIELARVYFELPPTASSVGAVLSPRELAANKVLALFGRVAPRDLCDMATLSSQRDLERTLVDAKTKDPGFSRPILAEMIRMVLHLPDKRWPPGVDIAGVRGFGERLAKALDADEALDGFQPAAPIWPDPAVR